jgi:hypothetical protein
MLTALPHDVLMDVVSLLPNRNFIVIIVILLYKPPSIKYCDKKSLEYRDETPQDFILRNIRHHSRHEGRRAYCRTGGRAG